MDEALMIKPETNAACGCMRHAARKPLWMLIGWLAAMLASLAIVELPYDFEETFCGIWGCFPPIQSLLAMHLFWCATMGAGIWALREFRPRYLRSVGLLFCALGALAFFAIVGMDLSQWLQKVPQTAQVFWMKRVGYTVATCTDVPMLQVFWSGVVALILSPSRSISEVLPPTTTDTIS